MAQGAARAHRRPGGDTCDCSARRKRHRLRRRPRRRRAAGAQGLVVDDTEDIRSLMRMALERAGFDVVADAEDGEEAIVVAGEHNPT